jgi:hypothetical protein
MRPAGSSPSRSRKGRDRRTGSVKARMPALLDGLVSVERGPVHLAGRAGVVGQRAVQHAAVVPDDEVADAPLVAVDAVRRGRRARMSSRSAWPSSRSIPTT